MRFLKKPTFVGLVAAIGLLVAVTAVMAAAFSLSGEAAIVQPGNNSDNAVQLVSDDDPGFGLVDFEVAGGTTFASLSVLSAEYNVTDDDCGGGSPRFQLNLDTTNDGISDGNVHVLIGPSPNFTGCGAGWQSTGNLIGNNDAGRYDLGQFGGSAFATYNDAMTLVGTAQVVGIQLVVDGGWFFDDGEQSVLVDNVTINADSHDFEVEEEPTEEPQFTKDDCKNGGWRDFPSPPGPFRNQGDCVSYFATGGRNPANG